MMNGQLLLISFSYLAIVCNFDGDIFAVAGQFLEYADVLPMSHLA